MARKALSPACLEVVQAVRPVLERACEYPITPIRIGVSGGADSMSLAAAFAHLVSREFPEANVSALVVDHGLQAGSDEVAARTAEAVSAMGIRASVVAVDVVDDGVGMEAAARDARLAALTRHFSGMVVLGHNLNDQAETVLLGLARGSGTRSLAGIAQQMSWGKATLVRPLLALTRATLRQAAQDWGLAIWDDPQNQWQEFARVRVRNVVMPTLVEALGVGVVAGLARSAELCRYDADFLDELAKKEWQPDETLDTKWLSNLPPALATRVIRLWLGFLGVEEPTFTHTMQVWELVTNWRGQQGVDLPGKVRIARRAGKLKSG